MLMRGGVFHHKVLGPRISSQFTWTEKEEVLRFRYNIYVYNIENMSRVEDGQTVGV